jgi:glutamine amidotransferase
VRDRCGIKMMSPVNLFLADGNTLAGVRFTFDYGCYVPEKVDQLTPMSLRYLSLWYTLGTRFGLHDGEWKMVGGGGSADSVLVASEPLSHDLSCWVEVPEYSMVWVDRANNTAQAATLELDV